MMFIKHVGVFGLILFMVSSMSFAGEYQSLTQIGVSAESIGRGGISGIEKKPYSLFENPAAMNESDAFSISLFNTTFLNDLNYKNLSMSAGTSMGTFGAGVMQSSVGDLVLSREVLRDGVSENEAIGQFDYKNKLTSFAYKSPQINHWLNIPIPVYLGASFNLFRFDAANYSGEGKDFNMGLYLDTKTTALSFYIKNLLNSEVVYTDSSDSSYDGRERLSRTIVFSGKHHLSPLDLEVLGEYQIKKLSKLMSFGLTYQPRWMKILGFSLGRRTTTVLGEPQGNITMGLSLKLRNVGFHYSVEKSEHVLLNYKHYFSIDYRLARPKVPQKKERDLEDELEEQIRRELEAKSQDTDEVFVQKPKTPAPHVVITTPDNWSRVSQPTVIFKGQADHVSSIVVDSKQAVVGPDGHFEIELSLEKENENNDFIIEALGVDGSVKQIRQTVFYDKPVGPDPVVNLVFPKDGYRSKKGKVLFKALLKHVAVVRVNGQPADFFDQGRVVTDLILKEGENVFDFEFVGKNGLIQRYRRTVFYEKERGPSPEVNLIYPLEGFKTNKNQVLFKALYKNVKEVRVNDEMVPSLSDERIIHNLFLKEGENVFEIEFIGNNEDVVTFNRRIILEI